jgi:CBS domain-containing protein
VEKYLFRYPYKIFPVVDKDGLLGAVSPRVIMKVPREKWSEVKVGEICMRGWEVAFPDSDLQRILDMMYRQDLSRVFIVDENAPRRIVGILTKADILRAIEKQRLGA